MMWNCREITKRKKGRKKAFIAIIAAVAAILILAVGL